MDPKKKEQRALEKAAAKLAVQLQQAGVKLPEEVRTMDFKEAAREAQSNKFDNPSLEAEAVLQFLHRPAKFLLKHCKREACGQPFGTNYHAVAYCSDTCRIIELRSQTGILWNPYKAPEKRWGGEPPLIIPPAAINAMVNLLRKSRHKADQLAADEIQTQIQTQIGTQVQRNFEESEVMSEIPAVDPARESEETPIAREAAAVVYSTQTPEPEPEQPLQPEQSPESQETDSEDVPSQGDNTETTNPQEQLVSPTRLKLDEEEFVFDFE